MDQEPSGAAVDGAGVADEQTERARLQFEAEGSTDHLLVSNDG